MQGLCTLLSLFAALAAAGCFQMSFKRGYAAAAEEDGPLYSIWVYRVMVLVWLAVAFGLGYVGAKL
jgi:hypothetical protein